MEGFEEAEPVRALQLVDGGHGLAGVAGALLGPAGHDAGDQPVEVGFERKLEPVLGLGKVLLVKGTDGQRQAREPLDVGNRLELVGVDQGFFEASLRDQRQHQALLQRGVTGSEGERLLVVGDGAVEIIVAFGDPRGKIGPRERRDIDWRGGLFGVGGQTGDRHARHNYQPCQPARTSLPHRIPFSQSHAHVSGIAVDSIFSKQSMAFLR